MTIKSLRISTYHSVNRTCAKKHLVGKINFCLIQLKILLNNKGTQCSVTEFSLGKQLGLAILANESNRLNLSLHIHLAVWSWEHLL